MLKNYVDLTLTDGLKDFSIEDVVCDNKNVVLLGVPGSGKSVLLDHFYEIHKDECELVRVKEFVKMPIVVKPTTKFFLIDGLDELRCASKEKESVIYDVISKLKEIEKKCHTLISCREMDWYGDNDDVALQKYLAYSVKKVYIVPLSKDQKESFANLYLEDDAKSADFNSKILNNNENSELLNIPQTLVMLLELFKNKNHPDEVPSKKIELYHKIVCLALEKKKTQLRESSCLSEDEVFKYAGYIAYFYMLSDFNNLDDGNLLHISDSPKYGIEKLKQVTELNIFENKPGENDSPCKKFSHRTIAEYLCAYFLSKNFSEEDSLQCLLSKNKKVPSELRGVFAWYCSLTESENCFSIDPYGQYIYGDNSLFSRENKKKVVKAIGNYANEIKPYFMHFGDAYRKNDFYESDLDDFLISEYKAGLDNKNNYLLFLGFVMTGNATPTAKILNFAKEVVSLPSLEYHFKEMFFDYLANDVIYLQEQLKLVVDGIMPDPEDRLLDKYLSLLYPETVKPSEIVNYLKKYKKHDCHYSQFLFLNRNKVAEKDTEFLVHSFYDKENSKLRENSELLNAIESFIGEYLFNLLTSTAPEIFLQKLVSLSQKDFNLTNGAWFSNIKKIQSVNENIRQQLYLNYLINTTANDLNQRDVFWTRRYCSQTFIETILPNNCIEIQKKLISVAKTNDFRLEILYEMYRLLRSDSKTNDTASDIVCEIAQNYDLLDRFKKGIEFNPSPEVARMMKENAEREKRRKEEIERDVKNNDKYFNSLKPDEKKSLWGWFVQAAAFYLISKDSEVESRLHISLNVYHELLELLKEKLFQDSQTRVYRDYATVQSLVENAPSSGRNVDELYYAMLCLNSSEDYEKLNDKDFLEYLYIIALHESHVANSKDSEFLEWFESTKLDCAIKIIEKFILLFFSSENEVEKRLISFFDKEGRRYSLDNKQGYLQKLQAIVYFTDEKLSPQENIVNKLMHVFDFQLDANLLISFTLSDSLALKRDSLVKFIKNDTSICESDIANLVEIIGFRWHSFNLKSIITEYQTAFIDSMMKFFSTEESMNFHSGIQSTQDTAAFYVNNVMLKQIEGADGKKMLEKLLEKSNNSLWIPRIKTRIEEIEETLTDTLKTKKTIDEAKRLVQNATEENRMSVTNVFNAPVNNSAIVNSAVNSPVTVNVQNGIDYVKLQNIVEQIVSSIDNAGFSADQKATIQSDIQEIQTAICNREESKIRSILGHIKNVCDGVVGSLIADCVNFFL